MKVTKILFIFCNLVFLLGACVGSNAVGMTNLEGEIWTLKTINGIGPLDDRRPTLKFETGQVSGNTGCNQYGGSYQIEGDSIQFDELFSTEMACMDPTGIMQQEQIYLELLRTSERFKRTENTLTLSTADGQTLIFTNLPETIVISTATATLEPETPTHAPDVVVPTAIPTFEPPLGFKEYQDSVAGVSLYLPESWAVTSVILGQSAILQSYPVDKYVGGEALAPGDTKCDLSIRPGGESAADLIAQWRSDAMTTIVTEEEISSKTGLSGQRFVIDSMGRATVFIFEINQRAVLLTCFGDFTRVDAIATTLKASE
jgi:heat shock protein HslJ